jgi:hypothetical protein
MTNFSVYRTRQDSADIKQLSIKREWMDNTYDRHAYHCFPVTLTNGLGWGVSFPEDISFVWDGVFDSSPDRIKILKGEKYVFTGRGQATVSFNTGLIFLTDDDTSLLTMPVPNQFIPGASPFTTLISTSFFKGELPIAWMVTIPHLEITIPAGTPVASVMPISLSELQNKELLVIDSPPVAEFFEPMVGYSEVASEASKSGKWAHLYRDAVTATGAPMGRHEVKAIKLKTTHVEKNDENTTDNESPLAD